MNRNDIDNAMAAAASEAGTAYSLAYYPRSQKSDGQFRSIRVRVNQPGLELRYRLGYYALDQSKQSPREKASGLLAALTDPLPATEIVFFAHTVKEREGRLTLEFKVPADQVTFQPGPEDKKRFEMEFVVAAVGADGKLALPESKTVTADLRREALASIQAQGVPFRMEVEAAGGAQSYRVLVRDKLSGRIGRVDIPRL